MCYYWDYSTSQTIDPKFEAALINLTFKSRHDCDFRCLVMYLDKLIFSITFLEFSISLIYKRLIATVNIQKIMWRR
jgi:hypothetical protein